MSELKPGQIYCSRDNYYDFIIWDITETGYQLLTTVSHKSNVNVDELERVISNFYKLEAENAKLKEALKISLYYHCGECKRENCDGCKMNIFQKELGI